MLEAARKIARFTSGHRSAEELLARESDFWSVVHMLEIIGEAAAHVSPETRALLPLPWLESVATRNFLATSTLMRLSCGERRPKTFRNLRMYSRHSLIAKQEESER
jgi:uncharacterized protein with HEPN domain